MVDYPGIAFLERLVNDRNSAQRILFDLLKFVREHQSKIQANDTHNDIFQLLVGVSFSLWRVVFLAQDPFKRETALAGAQENYLKRSSSPMP